MPAVKSARAAFEGALTKSGFVAYPQGAPPPDPSMPMGAPGGMPPGAGPGGPGGPPPMGGDPGMAPGAPPMDPMMGMPSGQQPMDPSMGMPPGGAPPSDPSAMPPDAGGMPPDPSSLGAMAAPPGQININPQELIDIINAAKGGIDPAASMAGPAAAPGATGAGASAAGSAKPKKPGTQEILDAVNGIGQALGMAGGAPPSGPSDDAGAPPAGGMVAQASVVVPVPRSVMRKMAATRLAQVLDTAVELFIGA